MKFKPEHQPDIVPVSNDPVLYRLRQDWRVPDVPGSPGHKGVPLSAVVGNLIPAGFEYDGMSAPRAAWSVAGLTPDGVQRAGTLVHDWLYRNKGRAPGWPVLARLDADGLLLDLCLAAGMEGGKARTVYDAVRDFGWIFWNRLHEEHAELRPWTTSLGVLARFARENWKLAES